MNDAETEIASELGKHKNVLFMAHAASIIALTRELVGSRRLAMRVGCCSLTTLVPKPSAELWSPPRASIPSTSESKGVPLTGQWQFLRHPHDDIASPSCADASFLPNGPERDWGFADIEVSEGEVVNDVGESGADGVEEEEGDRGLQVMFSKEVLASLGLESATQVEEGVDASSLSSEPNSKL